LTEFTAAARSLLLPVDPRLEADYHTFLAGRLAQNGIAQEDQSTWINLELRRWRSGRVASPRLRQLINLAIFDQNRVPQTYMFENTQGGANVWLDIASRMAQTYFALHAILVDTHLLSHDAARQLIAQAGMIARLAVVEGMSASEITRILAARDSGFVGQWPVVTAMLSRLGCAPNIDADFVGQLFVSDENNEQTLFGDLSLEGSISRVGNIARELGSDSAIETALENLIISDRHEPYLLILHYQMIIQDRYDHAVSYAYEFSPRGNAVRWLNDQYIEAGIPVAANAYLNNAKALLKFDRSWAVGRSDHRRGAEALVAVLASIESLGPLAKTEIAAWIRGLLHRYIRFTRQEQAGLNVLLAGWGVLEFNAAFRAIGEANSGTTGIAEQRLVDCLATLRHPADEGWAGRGVGDSVFAPNVPRRKCGDCEFELARGQEPRIEAYEAHGGQLSGPYVDDHMASLRQVIRLRAEDLAAVQPLPAWSFRVTFVAHTFSEPLPQSVDIETDHGTAVVALRYLRFDQAAQELIDFGDIETFHDHFLVPINSGYVHPRIRERLVELVGLA
jgi:hypothetical protein